MASNWSLVLHCCSQVAPLRQRTLAHRRPPACPHPGSARAALCAQARPQQDGSARASPRSPACPAAHRTHHARRSRWRLCTNCLHLMVRIVSSGWHSVADRQPRPTECCTALVAQEVKGEVPRRQPMPAERDPHRLGVDGAVVVVELQRQVAMEAHARQDRAVGVQDAQ
eukprot:11717507-Alexandrium_andersonii.AAC.1